MRRKRRPKQCVSIKIALEIERATGLTFPYERNNFAYKVVPTCMHAVVSLLNGDNARRKILTDKRALDGIDLILASSAPDGAEARKACVAYLKSLLGGRVVDFSWLADAPKTTLRTRPRPGLLDRLCSMHLERIAQSVLPNEPNEWMTVPSFVFALHFGLHGISDKTLRRAVVDDEVREAILTIASSHGIDGTGTLSNQAIERFSMDVRAYFESAGIPWSES